MNKKALIVGGVVLLVILIAIVTVSVGAATTSSVRGLVQKVDESTGTIEVYVNHTSSNLTTLKGDVVTFKVKSATFTKIVSGKAKASKLASVKANEDEVLLKGVKKSGSTYTATSVEITERKGRFVGKVKDKNLAEKMFKVEVTYSSYKSSVYKGKEVWVTYDGDTTFTANGASREADEIATKDQKARVEFKLKGGGTIYVTEFEDDYKKDK